MALGRRAAKLIYCENNIRVKQRPPIAVDPSFLGCIVLARGAVGIALVRTYEAGTRFRFSVINSNRT